MADEFECPDCHAPFMAMPSRCGCGWINPSIQKRAEAASIQHQETIYDRMPGLRRQADERVAAAKSKYGDQWRDKFMEELKREARHSAILTRREQRQIDTSRLDRLKKYRAESGYDPTKSIYYSEENFHAHVASLRAAGVQVTVIGENSQEIVK